MIIKYIFPARYFNLVATHIGDTNMEPQNWILFLNFHIYAKIEEKIEFRQYNESCISLQCDIFLVYLIYNMILYIIWFYVSYSCLSDIYIIYLAVKRVFFFEKTNGLDLVHRITSK